MLMIHVSVHSEQSLEDGLGVGEEVVGEGDTDLAGEEVLIVQLVLHPGHQEVNVLGCRTLDWFLHLVTISPVILATIMRTVLMMMS